MAIYFRLDEDEKSDEQKDQRERTYEAAKLLRQAGISCHVVEWMTFDNLKADAAGIVLDR